MPLKINQWQMNSPAAVAPPVQMPAQDNTFLAQALSQMRETQKRPISTPVGGIANALTQGLQGYFAGNRARADQAVKQKQLQDARDWELYKLDRKTADQNALLERQGQANADLVRAMAQGRGYNVGGPVEVPIGETPGLPDFQAKADPLVNSAVKAAETGLVSADQLGSVFPPAQKMSDKERQIQSLMRQGVSRNDAENIAYGVEKTITDPVSGTTSVVNTATREGTPIKGPLAQQVEAGNTVDSISQNAEGVDLSSAAESGTGMHAVVSRGMAAFTGAITGGAIDLDEQDAAARAIYLYNQMVKSAFVNNPRFPEFEQRNLERLLANPDALFTYGEREARKLYEQRKILLERGRQMEKEIEQGILPKEDQKVYASVREALSMLSGLAGPKVGHVVERDGTKYRYNGGHPKTKASWDVIDG